jgi:hypothetical protein
MDTLKQSINVLRALTLQASDQNVYVLAEQEIAQHSENPTASLEKLKAAIDKVAGTSQHHITFWTTMREFLSRPGSERWDR